MSIFDIDWPRFNLFHTQGFRKDEKTAKWTWTRLESAFNHFQPIIVFVEHFQTISKNQKMIINDCFKRKTLQNMFWLKQSKTCFLIDLFLISDSMPTATYNVSNCFWVFLILPFCYVLLLCRFFSTKLHTADIGRLR